VAGFASVAVRTGIEWLCDSLEEGWRAVGRVETADCGRGRPPDRLVRAVVSLPRFFPRRAGRYPMSVAFHTQTLTTQPVSASPEPPKMTFETEAPDRGEREHEAPETRQQRQAEAPDAGDGRANWLEHEFTHGRSQS
jgi:hypothetical protein